MTDRKMLALAVAFVTCCGCSEDKLRGDVPVLERYFLGPYEAPPPPTDFTALPNSDRLAVDFG